MSWKFSDEARRILLYARSEACDYGIPYVEPEHLMLGLMREDRLICDCLFSDAAQRDSFEKRLRSELPHNPKIAATVDLPHSHRAKRVVANGAEEAKILGDELIGPIHLLLGLLREENKASVLLQAFGVDRESAIKKAQFPHQLRNEVIAGQLRREFEPLAARLTPDIEPAIRFSVQADVGGNRPE